MTASELLRITKPEDLFPGDIEQAKQVYRGLARQWHPDHGGQTEVFAHITHLYDLAISRLQNGLWEGSGVVEVQGVDKHFRLLIRASAPFVLGQSLVSDDFVYYLINDVHTKFVGHTRQWPTQFRYDNDKMHAEFARYLPREIATAQLLDGRLLCRIDKTPDLLRLRDVVTHLGGLEPRHVAWVTSRLLNLACYLSHVGIVHHDISPDTVFISPEYHSIALLGGWWFAGDRGSPMPIIPRRTFDLLPFKVKTTKLASSLTDGELIRATALECLTIPAPEPMQIWLQSVNGGSLISQYTEWMNALKKAYGPRKFVKLELTADQVYGHNGKH